jgi:3-keto-disaccharide hydrolase
MRIYLALPLAATVLAATLPVIHWKPGDRNRPQPPLVTPPTPSTQERPGAPPSDAIVLFDGKDLSAWRQKNGKPPAWHVRDGYFEVVPRTGDLVTKQAFGDCQLHVEWASPTPTRGHDQEPGNSGVYLQSLYEVQVLESYNNKTYPDGQAGAVYCQYPPLVNPSHPPGEWQTYDIVFHAARFSGSQVEEPATITLLFNGVLAQDHVALTGPTDYMKRPPYKPGPAKLPLLLQDHWQRVRYRNIWIRELHEPAS